jgi:hypothetical protein
MKEPVQPPNIEPRWPVALAILAVLFLLAVLPDRVRLLPVWFNYLIGIALLATIAVVGLTEGKAQWLRVERTGVLVFFVVKGVTNLATLAYLINAMVSRAKLLMMLESTISLATIIVVVSRAINIFGS